MANLKASDNPFPSVLFAEHVDPSNPAASHQRLFVDTDHLLKMIDSSGTVTTYSGSSGLTDPMTTRGDIIYRDSSNTTARLGRGSASQVLTSDGTDIAWATPAATVYTQPTVTNYAAQFQATSTSCAVTVTAPTTGDKLIAIVYSIGRGANSITQTNVTWTQRYTGNGNSQYLEVWTGVVSGTGGTTATAAFTGSNTQYVEIMTINSAASAFTAASASATATAATTALATVTSGALTLGNHYIIATSANSPSTSYTGCSHSYVPLTAFGGIARSGIFRANAAATSYWSLSSSAVNYFTAVIAIT